MSGLIWNGRFGAAELPEMKAIDLRSDGLAPGALDFVDLGTRSCRIVWIKASSRCYF